MPEMFKDVTLVVGVVDRLTYHSHILNMNGESYRFQNACKKKSQFFTVKVAQKFTVMRITFSLTFTAC